MSPPPQTKKPQATNPGASKYAYAWRDSNPQPILSQETALSVELQTYAVRTLESGLITESRFFQTVYNFECLSTEDRDTFYFLSQRTAL